MNKLNYKNPNISSWSVVILCYASYILTACSIFSNNINFGKYIIFLIIIASMITASLWVEKISNIHNMSVDNLIAADNIIQNEKFQFPMSFCIFRIKYKSTINISEKNLNNDQKLIYEKRYKFGDIKFSNCNNKKIGIACNYLLIGNWSLVIFLYIIYVIYFGFDSNVIVSTPIFIKHAITKVSIFIFMNFLTWLILSELIYKIQILMKGKS